MGEIARGREQTFAGRYKCSTVAARVTLKRSTWRGGEREKERKREREREQTFASRYKCYTLSRPACASSPPLLVCCPIPKIHETSMRKTVTSLASRCGQSCLTSPFSQLPYLTSPLCCDRCRQSCGSTPKNTTATILSKTNSITTICFSKIARPPMRRWYRCVRERPCVCLGR